MSRPRASFLVPVRDAAASLEAAMQCLLVQTVPEHEVLIADDGSKDATLDVANALAARDPRVRVLPGPRHDISRALNRALANARADVVVRMDGDDTCPPERLALLLETLDARPDVAVVGSRVEMVPPEHVGLGMRRYLDWQNGLLDHDAMARERFIESPITHATCAFRREALERVGGWSEEPVPEDVDLWLRLFADGARFLKRPETLYLWHEHERRTTRRHVRYTRDAFLRCKAGHLARLVGERPMAVWGHGRSRGEWEAALETAGATLATGGALDPRALRRPGAALPWAAREAASGERTVLVLPFLSSRVRRELRAALTTAGERELVDFVFVA